MTPRQIVEELDRFIIGQKNAKRSVAIAVRNRWRRQNVGPEIRDEIAPKNIMMIGPTGVGKTEIARRLAALTGAPFIKVEATKYTEVGYYGRDVESMIRELVENAIGLVRAKERESVKSAAMERVSEKLVDLLLPPGPGFGPEGNPEDETSDEMIVRRGRNRDRIRQMLLNGDMENRKVTISIEQKNTGMPMMMGIGVDSMDSNIQDMLEKFMPRKTQRREMTVADAREHLYEEECENLINKDKVNEEAIKLAENLGMIFIDEMDKIVASDKTSGADVSRQGVQRDLLPVVEGTTVQTRYGYVATDHILFIAAGAFHKAKPSDLMPELQGRFPIRVELQDLTRDDFIRILTEPTGSLTKQYAALMLTEGVELVFEPDAIEKLADYAFEVNQSQQNIGARRLSTIMERLLEELSFEAPEMKMGCVVINAAYVTDRLESISQNEDLSQFIL